ncbi:MAG: DUF1573 domain-containing protein [Paramuribaculum sp.]|nr:DUF1573 domain-containing protein [Paramuribaculum sp.]
MSSKILTAVAATAITCLGVAAQSSNMPPLKWLETNYNFGSFSEDVGKVTAVFTGVNEQTDTVVVMDLRATCGCTTPTVDRRVIAPGDSVRLTVVFDPANRPGPFEKRVMVSTHPGPDQNLYIAGRVIPPAKSINAHYPHDLGFYSIDHKGLAFGTVYDGNPRKGTIRGFNTTQSSITPTVSYMPEWITADSRVSPVGSGENFDFIFHIDPDKIPEYGVVNDSVALSSVEHPETVTYIPVGAIRTELFGDLTEEDYANAPYAKIADQKVDFGVIDPLSDKPVVRELEIVNTGKQPLKIRRIYSLDAPAEFSIDHKEIKGGKNAKIKITLNPSALKGREILNARMLIISNAPANSTVGVRLVGEVK